MIRIAIAGLGRAGEAHARHHRAAGNTIVGIADPTPRRQALARALFPDAHIADTLDQLGVDADLAIICTPPASHTNDIHTALTRGMHVFCEKPAVLDPHDGIALAQQAADHKLLLYPGHNYLFAPFTRMLQDAIRQDLGGLVHHLDVTIQRPAPATGTIDWQPNWRQDPIHASGGILTDHGPHAIYLAELLLDAPIAAVSCATRYPTKSSVEYDAVLNLRTHTNTTATIQLSWSAPGRHNRYTLRGRNGTIDLQHGRLKITKSTRESTTLVPDPAANEDAYADWLPDMAAEVVAAVAAPDTYRARWQVAITVAQVMQAGYRSAANHGEWLPIGP